MTNKQPLVLHDTGRYTAEKLADKHYIIFDSQEFVIVASYKTLRAVLKHILRLELK